jgi:hypothetical protein
LLALITVYVAYTEHDYFGNKQSDLSHYQAMKWILIPHALFGIIALASYGVTLVFVLSRIKNP